MTDRWCLAQGSSLRVRRASDERRRVPASITFVSVEKETSARGRLVGSARAVHRRPRLRVLVYLLWYFPFGCCSLVCGKPWSLGPGIGLLLGNLSFVACLPQLTHCLGAGSCPNHRLSAVGLFYALETINYKLNDVDPTLS